MGTKITCWLIMINIYASKATTSWNAYLLGIGLERNVSVAVSSTAPAIKRKGNTYSHSIKLPFPLVWRSSRTFPLTRPFGAQLNTRRSGSQNNKPRPKRVESEIWISGARQWKRMVNNFSFDFVVRSVLLFAVKIHVSTTSINGELHEKRNLFITTLRAIFHLRWKMFSYSAP